ncbi:hypothetical protein CUT44_02695 [Streptomyces carminius]|uniref:Secreted protein n=1 Tax=Streptomyces carminius TaxID=2665496 RepID=A0A2M8MBL5_9ACTN|nr:hypothetical protein [Streptomyces carminius]PJF01580.1 hypothetical protein CUT44_02695 [Streptomyces carminius]
MKSWRSRVAAAAGIAAVVIPLAAGSASADEVDHWGYRQVGGWRDYRACEQDGLYYLSQGWQNFYCKWEAPYWNLWVLPYKDQPPTRG